MRRDPTPRWSSADVELFLLTPDAVGDAYVGWLNDPEVNQYLESRFAPQGHASIAAFVAGALASEKDLLLGIRSVALGRHVGNIKLGPINREHGLGEVGIMIGDRGAWGQGLASRAIAMLRDIAAEELGLRRLTAGCYASNIGSRRAFERAGFTVEAVRSGHFLLNGEPEDLVLMGCPLRAVIKGDR